MLDAEIVQRSPEWYAAIAGSVGASEVADVVRRTKAGGVSASRASLMARKLLERITGCVIEGYKSQPMLEGIEREPKARATYTLMSDNHVDLVGLVRHPFIKGSHASPDGLVGWRGLVEIKCPQPPAHLDTLLSEAPERDHVLQMQWQMACTGRDWDDYVSFCPVFPGAMSLFVTRVERDPKLIWELEEPVAAFIAELEKKLERLRDRYCPVIARKEAA